MKAVVIAGGKGTRLGLGDLPKAMVDVDGTPLLERTVRAAVRDGITDFIFLTGHLSNAIERHFGDGQRFGATIRHVVEKEPLGTAGAFREIRDLLTEPFVVIYGDVLMDVDLRAFADAADRNGGAGTLFVHPNDHPYDSDLLECDENGRIVAFHPKPHAEGALLPNLVNAALYLLHPRVLDYIPVEGQSDWGRDVLPIVAREESMFGYRSCEYVKDIGTPDRLTKAVKSLRDGKLDRLALRTAKPVLFLDRDGVINEEVDGALSPSQVTVLPGVASAIRAFNDAGIPVICVTNQPALAKGFMSWQDLRDVGAEIDRQLADQAGAYLDDLLICPHHPEAGWEGEVPALKIDCDCRKPGDGMLRTAAAMHNIDLGRSWLVGDRYCDVAAAASAGAHSILVRGGHGGNDRSSFDVRPDHVVADLAEAAPLILADLT